jgi:hypothetical protein
MKYTILTVAHAIDRGLLSLQARSMALYCPLDLVHEVLIIENFDEGEEADWRPGLVVDYGPLASRVRFVPAGEVSHINARHQGWWKQQVLKIAAAEVISSPRYLVLDAKNHLFRPLDRGFLENRQGKPLLNGYGFEKHSLRDALIRTLTYLNVDPAPFIPRFTRTSTPFLMLTDVSREIVAYIEGREDRPFADAFLDRRLTEFFLYAGYLQSRGLLDAAYDMSQPYCAQVWAHSAGLHGVREALGKAANPQGGPFLSVHRGALIDMDTSTRKLLAGFWFAAGLFRSLEAGVRFSHDPNG